MFLNGTIYLTDSCKVYWLGFESLDFVDGVQLTLLSEDKHITELAVTTGQKLYCLMLDRDGTIWMSQGICADADHILPKANERPQKVATRLTAVPFKHHVASFSCSETYALVVDDAGNVYQLETNDSSSKAKDCSLSLVSGVKDIKSVVCGKTYALLIDHQDQVWSRGANEHGQLGLGTTTKTNEFKQVKNIPPIQSASAFYYHSLLLDYSGQVWGAGYNFTGQLGSGGTMSTTTFQIIPTTIPIKQISAAHHTLMLDIDGGLWVCGFNQNGQLGLEHTNHVYTAELLSYLPPIENIQSRIQSSWITDVEGYLHFTGYVVTGRDGKLRTTFAKLKSIPRPFVKKSINLPKSARKV